MPSAKPRGVLPGMWEGSPGRVAAANPSPDSPREGDETAGAEALEVAEAQGQDPQGAQEQEEDYLHALLDEGLLAAARCGIGPVLGGGWSPSGAS